MARLILIAGLSGTGKTTLGRRLSRELKVPFLTKDDFKERISDHLGWSDRAWSKKVSLTCFDLLYYVAEELLTAGVSVIMDANFYPEVETPRYAELRARVPFDLTQIWCRTKPEVLLERFQARTRHPCHLDKMRVEEFMKEIEADSQNGINLPGERVEIDATTFDYMEEEIRAIVERLRA